MLRILANLLLDAKIAEDLLNRGVLERFTHMYLEDPERAYSENLLLCIQRFSNSLSIKMGQRLKNFGYSEVLFSLLDFFFASDFDQSHLLLVLEALKNYLFYDREDEGLLIKEMAEGEVLEELTGLQKKVD